MPNEQANMCVVCSLFLIRNRNLSWPNPFFGGGAYISSDWFDLLIEVSPVDQSQEKRPNLEVQSDQREDEGFQILYQVVEYTKSFRVCRFGDIYQRANFRSLSDRGQQMKTDFPGSEV